MSGEKGDFSGTNCIDLVLPALECQCLLQLGQGCIIIELIVATMIL